MRNPRRWTVTLVILLASSLLAKASVTFDFSNDTSKATPFTDTAGGVSATFSSSGDPGGFDVLRVPQPVIFGFTSPGPYGVLNTGGHENLSLTIAFSALLTSISLEFVLNSYGTNSINLAAFDGASSAGDVSASAVGTFDPPRAFIFAAGEIGFTGTAFNSVVLTSSAPNFAIYNLGVNPVPEPSSASLLIVGVLAVVYCRKRTLRAKCSPARSPGR